MNCDKETLVSKRENGKKGGKKHEGGYVTRGFQSPVKHLIPPSFSSLFALPHCKALFISPCLLHVDMENILGCNSNDSYTHTLSLRSLFVFKLHFSPNRVYKPCLGRGDHSLLYCLDCGTQGFYKEGPLHGNVWWEVGQTGKRESSLDNGCPTFAVGAWRVSEYFGIAGRFFFFLIGSIASDWTNPNSTMEKCFAARAFHAQSAVFGHKS